MKSCGGLRTFMQRNPKTQTNLQPGVSPDTPSRRRGTHRPKAGKWRGSRPQHRSGWGTSVQRVPLWQTCPSRCSRRRGGADPKPPAGRHLAPQVCWRPSRQWQQSPQRLRFGVGGVTPVRRYSRLPLCSRRQARLRVLGGSFRPSA